MLSISAQTPIVNVRGDPNAGTDWGVVSIDVVIIPTGNFSDALDIIAITQVLEILVDGEDVVEGEYGSFKGIYSVFYYTTLQREVFVNNEYVSIELVEFVSATVKFKNGKTSPLINTTNSHYYIQSNYYGIGGLFEIDAPENRGERLLYNVVYVLGAIGFLFTLVLLRSKRLRHEIFGTKKD